MKTRLKRFKDKDTRKLIGVILAGKMAAVVLLLGEVIGRWCMQALSFDVEQHQQLGLGQQ